MREITVTTLRPTRRNLLRFIRFQLNMYRDNEYFVPPLIIDELNTLNPRSNPAFDFCEVEYFMAERDGIPVGRIAAIINRQVNQRDGTATARFGFFDCIDDSNVAAALLRAAEQWAKDRGMTRMIGPLGFTDLDREGVLTFGFDELSTMATNYNYPYYADLIKADGYTQSAEWLEFVMDVPDGIPEKMNRIADIVKKRTGLRVKKYTSRRLLKRDYGRKLFYLINETYDKLFGYSPLTERQIDAYISQYINLLDLDFVCLIVDKDEELVGVGISMPSMSRALQKCRGKLLPFGWLPLLKGLKGRNDRVDLMLVGIRPDYQNKGVNALLFQDLIPHYIKRGFRWAESNPELNDNTAVQGQWQYFGHRQHRRRIALAKDL